MQLFEAYRAIRRHNYDMARWMYDDLLFKIGSHIIVDVDTDEDFYLTYQSPSEENDDEFHIDSFNDLKAELQKRLPPESIYESRREAVATFIDVATRYLLREEATIRKIAAERGSFYDMASYGNWSVGIEVKVPATKYTIFGQVYDITEEDMARIKEDVECLPTPEESAQ